MKTRSFRVALLGLAVMLVVAACGGADPTPTSQPTVTPVPQDTPTPAPTADPRDRGGTLVIGKPTAFTTLDPLYTTTSGQHTTWPVYDSLISRGVTRETVNEFRPGLASSWDVSQDSKQITLNLREANWHDGQPFTAADAEYSFDAIFNPPEGLASGSKGRLGDVATVQVVDDRTLVITTKRPTTDIIEAISIVRMAPKHKHATERPFLRTALGTGPFKFESVASDESRMILVRNTDYWRSGGEPLLDAIDWVFLGDTALIVPAIKTKRIDVWGSDFSKGHIPLIKGISGLRIDAFPKLQYATLWFRHGIGMPWEDIRVRQAMSLAIDRPAHRKAAWLDTDEVAQFTLPGKWALPASEVAKAPGWGPDFAANLARAKQLMKDAGYADGFKATIKYPTSGNWDPSSNVLQQMLREIKVDLTLKGADVATTAGARNKGEFELLNWPNVPSLSSPNDILLVFSAGGTYVKHGWSDAELNGLWDRALGAFDVAERLKLVNEMERILFRELPALPTVSRSGTMGVWNYVMDFAPTGLWFNSGTFQMRTTWIDQSKK